MSKIYFVCGFIGAGKTTYSKQLAEAHGAFRFPIDEWMIPLYGEHMEREVFDRRLATLKELFKSSAMQLFSLGVPVIFDFGFWRKTDRSSFIDWASNLGRVDLCCIKFTQQYIGSHIIINASDTILA